MHHVQLGELPKAGGGVPVFEAAGFETPWQVLEYVDLAPGEGFSPPAASPGEDGLALLEGAIEGAEGERVRGPAALRCGVGREFRVFNRGDQVSRLLYVRVGMDEVVEDDESFLVEAVDPARLKWRPAIHGGAGRIATRHLWGPDDFRSTWTFWDHAMLAPHSSVGYHYHDALEECFVILRGRGHMTIADATFAVEPGAVTWQGIREGHGIYNPGTEELEFLRLAVAQPGEAYTTVDLHDDLAGRRP